MSETVIDTDEFQYLLETAKMLRSPTVDLSKLLATEKPLYLTVDNALPAIVKLTQPQVSLHFDHNKTLSVKKLDGGLLFTFTVSF